jgi:hypothetical protein
MSWYSSNWKFRYPMSAYISASPSDVTITIPPTFQHFWDNVDATGDDVRVCDADGVTLEAFDLAAGFDPTTRTGTVEIDNVTKTTSRTVNFWLYYGYSAATTGVSAFVPGAPVSGNFCLDRPLGDLTVDCTPERPGSDRPKNVFAKKSGETLFLYWNVTPLLARRHRSWANREQFDEVSHINFSVQTGGADYASGYSSSGQRFIELPDGRFYVRTGLLAGVAGTDYTAILTVTTSQGAVFQPRAWIKVRDVDEA